MKKKIFFIFFLIVIFYIVFQYGWISPVRNAYGCYQSYPNKNKVTYQVCITENGLYTQAKSINISKFEVYNQSRWRSYDYEMPEGRSVAFVLSDFFVLQCHDDEIGISEREEKEVDIQPYKNMFNDVLFSISICDFAEPMPYIRKE